jgi:hypothetical protein
LTHPALSEDELYDDPPQAAAAQVAEVSPPPQKIEDTAKPKDKKYVAALSACLDILSYRVILLLSVLISGGLFGIAAWQPDPWRLGAAGAYSLIVVVPLTFFYARR